LVGKSQKLKKKMLLVKKTVLKSETETCIPNYEIVSVVGEKYLFKDRPSTDV
jgi:hypothetical protein